MFSAPGAIPADARRLSALSETDLASSLKALPVGERGWIPLREAAHLFSSKEPKYAFGETDEEGTHRLVAFATACKCRFEFMPMQGRLYFIRQG
jgi:hypothetical protein